MPPSSSISSPTDWNVWTKSHRTETAGDWVEVVQRSLITLKALTHYETGGIVAAPTTSLPEQLGGPRNWDYRYCWLRDATLTLYALLTSGFLEEAGAWRDWLIRAIAGSPDQMQIMYGIAGERRLDEYETALARRLRGLDAGAGRQRRGGPAPARRLRRGARRHVPGAAPGPRARRQRLEPRTRARRAPRDHLAAARRGHLGGARRPQALHRLESHGVDRLRPCHPLRRGVRAPRARSTAGGRRATGSTPMSARRATTPSAAISPSSTGAPRSTRACS